MIVKCIVLGDLGVGKSCLLQRLSRHGFESRYCPTIGVDYVSFVRDTIKFSVWDTSGHVRFRSIVEQYYRHVNICMIMYDVTCRHSFQNVSQYIRCWKNLLETDDHIMILIGNKSEETLYRQVSYVEGKNLANDVGIYFIEVSARTGHNVDEMVQKLHSFHDHHIKKRYCRCTCCTIM